VLGGVEGMTKRWLSQEQLIIMVRGAFLRELESGGRFRAHNAVVGQILLGSEVLGHTWPIFHKICL
jgi:hypothetical protein